MNINSNNNESVASEEGIEGKDYIFPFSSEVASNFEKVANLKKGETEVIIKYLKTKYADENEQILIQNVPIPPNRTMTVHKIGQSYPISDIIHRYSLKPVEFKDNTDNWSFNGTPLIKLGGGSFGNIFQNPSNGLIYKQTVLKLSQGYDLEIRCEDFYREFLLEAFIQVVLHTDNPSAVANITDIYIDSRIHRMSQRDTLSQDATLEKDVHPRLPLKSEREHTMEYSFFYIMNKIPYAFDSYAAKFGEENSPQGKILSLTQVKTIFNKLGRILNDLKHKYGFKHRDLHPGNLRFDKNGNPILIDFGKSCLKMEWWKVPPFSS